jgi:Flp pilus assembly protein TadD
MNEQKATKLKEDVGNKVNVNQQSSILFQLINKSSRFCSKRQGNNHFKTGNLDQAMTCYFEAVKYNPNDMNIYGNMAQVMIKKNE